MAKYEVVETEKNVSHEDGTPSVTNRWTCESKADALSHAHIRWVEAEIQGRTDVYFEAREDGEPIDSAGWEVTEEDVVFAALTEMGYTEGEILLVL